MTSQDALAAVTSAINQLWEEGCPVASRADEMAAVAVRRWATFSRRGVKRDDLFGRTRDLTKGLIAQFEADPAHPGPIRCDYECVAERVAAVLVKLGQ